MPDDHEAATEVLAEGIPGSAAECGECSEVPFKELTSQDHAHERDFGRPCHDLPRHPDESAQNEGMEEVCVLQADGTEVETRLLEPSSGDEQPEVPVAMPGDDAGPESAHPADPANGGRDGKQQWKLDQDHKNLETNSLSNCTDDEDIVRRRSLADAQRRCDP